MKPLALALVMLALAGCAPSAPTLTHGKPAADWLRALEDPNPRKRQRAADVLGNVGVADPAVVAGLADRVHDPDRGVRESAVLALLKIGPAARAAAPALAVASNDRDAKVRAVASRALEALCREP